MTKYLSLDSSVELEHLSPAKPVCIDPHDQPLAAKKYAMTAFYSRSR